MIYVLINGKTMAYVEADSPEEAHTLVYNALGNGWEKESNTLDMLLRGTVIVTSSERNQN